MSGRGVHRVCMDDQVTGEPKAGSVQRFAAGRVGCGIASEQVT
jgi:hypothetical protein